MSRFGAIPVEEAPKHRFGALPVDETARIQEREPGADPTEDDSPGFFAGLGGSLKRGWKSQGQQSAVLQAEALQREMMGQAYAIEAAKRSHAEAVRMFGPDHKQAAYFAGGVEWEQAKLRGYLAEHGQRFEEIARLEVEKEAIPLSDGFARWAAAGDGEAWSAFIANPAEVTANIMGESLSGSSLTMALTALGSALGPPGMAAAAAGGGFAQERASQILERLGQEIDLTDPEELKAAFADKELMGRVTKEASLKALPVAVAAAVSGGMAGRFVPKGAGGKALYKGLAKEAGAQTALEATGEAGGQLLADGELSLKEIAAEVIGSAGQSTVETAGGALRRSFSQAEAPAGEPALSGEEQRLFADDSAPAKPGMEPQSVVDRLNAGLAEAQAKDAAEAAPAEGQLFSEEEMPFNLTSEEAPDSAAALESEIRSRAVEQAQGKLFEESSQPQAQRAAEAVETGSGAGTETPITEEKTVKSGPKGSRPGVGLTPDGDKDILNAIEDLGGIKSPRASTNPGGEYDGFQETFGHGRARNLIVNKPTAQAPDQILADLAELGFPVADVNDLYRQVDQANQFRNQRATDLKREEQREKFHRHALEGERLRGQRKLDDAPLLVDEMAVGSTFTIAGQRVKVLAIDPDTYAAELDGGGRFGFHRLEPGRMVFIDRDSYQPAAGSQEAVGSDDPFRAASERFADIEPEQRERMRTALAEDQARWEAIAEKVAPGAMADLDLRLGSIAELSRLADTSKANREEIHAAYIAGRRMIFLAHSMMQQQSENMTLFTLQHELAHAHWDTLSLDRKRKLQRQFVKETESRTGPLYKAGKLRRGIARGADTDLGEWYAERVALANHQWAKARSGIGSVPVEGGIIGQAAQNLRRLWAEIVDFFRTRFGDKSVAVDFRKFLDQGTRFESEGRETGTSQVPALQPAAASFAQRELGAADLGITPTEKAARRRTIRERLRASPLGRLWAKEIKSAGRMPEPAFWRMMERDNRLRSLRRQIEYAIEDFNEAVELTYGGYRSLRGDRETALNQALAGDQGALNSLHPRLQGAVKRMRLHIDRSSSLLAKSGIVSGDLLAKVEGDIGLYLHRSYRKFDSKRWGRKVLAAKPGTELAAIREEAERLIHGEMRAELIREEADQQWQAAHPGKPLDRTGPAYREISERLEDSKDFQPEAEKVAGMIEYLLTKDVEPGNFIGAGKNPSKADLSSLMRRKQIAPEIRRLMGEHTDARINYARSVFKTMQMVETRRALNDVRKAGLGKWLFTEPRPGYAAELAAESNDAMAPLNGLYTSEDIKEALTKGMEPSQAGRLLKIWYAVNAWAKLSKTVASPVTHIRNIVGNIPIVAANGYLLPHKAGKPLAFFARELAGLTKKPEYRDYVAKLLRLGVVGHSVNGMELREAIELSGLKGSGEFDIERLAEGFVRKALKAPARKVAQLYALEDDFYKIYAFENEKSLLSWAQPNLTPDQVEELAARRVKLVMPNYDMLPKFVQRIRRAGLTGSFISFPAEMIRVSKNMAVMAAEDMVHGNARMKSLGALRAAGFLTIATGGAWMAQKASMALHGIDDEEDRRFREGLPPYAQNANLLYLGPGEEGRYRTMELSYADAFNWPKRIYNAIQLNEDPQQAALEALTEAMEPAFGEGLVSKALIDLARNQDDRGQPIVNKAKDTPGQIDDLMDYLMRTFEPGAVTTARRIKQGADGYVSPSGRVYVLKDEVIAATTGARLQSTDWAQVVKWKTKRYLALASEAARIYNEVANTEGTIDEAAIPGAYQAANEARERQFDELHRQVLNARYLGLSDGKILQSLVDGGLSADQAALVLAGFYVPYVPTRFKGERVR